MLYLLDLFLNPRTFIKKYLKQISRDKRHSRLVFLGRRAKARQNLYLYHNNHPWE